MFEAGEVADTSWHNDLAPSFGVEDVGRGYEIRIWIDHPDPAQHEFEDSDKRFTVSVYDENADKPAQNEDLEGYDFEHIKDAIAKFRKLVKKYTKR